jgi:arylsulfatase
MPGGEQTLIFYIASDNGADAASGRLGLGGQETVQARLENMDKLGGPSYFNNYASGWAWATSAPFQWEKHIASNFGGTRAPLVVSWPTRVHTGGALRTQFTDVTDIAATIYEVAHIKFPSTIDGVRQISMNGTSFAYSFEDPMAPSRHRMQIFEHGGNRAIYRDGWLAAARHSVPWLPEPGTDLAQDTWELYHIDEDFSEAHDLASQYPGKLREFQRLFDREAARNNVYPLGTSGPGQAPTSATAIKQFLYYPDIARLPNQALPNFSESHQITASVLIPVTGAEGTIFSYKSPIGSAGFTLYVKDDRVAYENGDTTIVSAEPLPRGRIEIVYEFVLDKTRATARQSNHLDSSGIGRLYVDGKAVGESEQSAPPNWGRLAIGQVFGPSGSSAFQPPFRFNGVIDQIRVEVK